MNNSTLLWLGIAALIGLVFWQSGGVEATPPSPEKPPVMVEVGASAEFGDAMAQLNARFDTLEQRMSTMERRLDASINQRPAVTVDVVAKSTPAGVVCADDSCSLASSSSAGAMSAGPARRVFSAVRGRERKPLMRVAGFLLRRGR